MSNRFAVFGMLGLTSLTSTGLEPLPEHIDIQPSYADGEWTWNIRGEGGDTLPELVFLPARDLAFPQGEGFLRPPGSSWDFLGMEAGEPVWILPQTDSGHTWPGLENEQGEPLGSYVETDPRVGGIAQPWIRIELTSVDGPGAFSLYQNQGGTSVVWMASSDGITADDVYFLASNGHDHMNWAFSQKGVYRVRLKASAFEGPGATNPTPQSEAAELFFTVGARAEWRASFFAADEVLDELIAGDDADPEHDGIANLLEYAFGTDPRSASPLNLDSGERGGPELLMVEDGGKHYPALRFFQRINDDADLVYDVEWSDAVDGGWEAGGIEHEVEDFGDGWERITIRDERATQGSRFGRVRVEVPE